jgi:hypothetical protein
MEKTMDRIFKNFEERNAFLRKVNEAHNDWSDEHANDEDVFNLSHSNPHDPTDDNTDYPIFYLDRSAPVEIEDEYFKKINDI